MKSGFFLVTLLLVSVPLRAEIDPLKKVAAELAQGIGRRKDARVAVLAIPHHDKRISEGPAYVSEKLSSYLVGDKRFSLVERGQMIQILSELHLSETGALDPKTTKKIGQALDANIIVTGTLINLGSDQAEVNARALAVDSGKVIAASRAIIDRHWHQKPRLGW